MFRYLARVSAFIGVFVSIAIASASYPLWSTKAETAAHHLVQIDGDTGIAGDLEADIKEVVQTETTLRDQSKFLQQKIDSNLSRQKTAIRLAAELRDLWQSRQQEGYCSVVWNGQEYNGQQAASQIKTLLSQAKGYHAAVSKIESVKTLVDDQVRSYQVQCGWLKTHLDLVPSVETLSRLSDSRATNQAMPSQASKASPLQSNPVRTLESLLVE